MSMQCLFFNLKSITCGKSGQYHIEWTDSFAATDLPSGQGNNDKDPATDGLMGIEPQCSIGKSGQYHIKRSDSVAATDLPSGENNKNKDPVKDGLVLFEPRYIIGLS